MSTPESFETLTQQPPPGFVAEFWQFLMTNKKWWLLPILIVILLLGLLAYASMNSAVAPFIYTLF